MQNANNETMRPNRKTPQRYRCKLWFTLLYTYFLKFHFASHMFQIRYKLHPQSVLASNWNVNLKFFKDIIDFIHFNGYIIVYISALYIINLIMFLLISDYLRIIAPNMFRSMNWEFVFTWVVEKDAQAIPVWNESDKFRVTMSAPQHGSWDCCKPIWKDLCMPKVTII